MDASAAARWLREKLLGFRPPKELLDRGTPERRVDLERRVAYFLDTSYQSANGRSFASASHEVSIRIAPIFPTPQALVEHACALMVRPLSRDQRRQFLLDENPASPPCGYL